MLKPKATKPNQYMTRIKLNGYLHWFTKEIIGYSVSMQSKTTDWLAALDMALNNKLPLGIAIKAMLILNA